MDVFHKWSLSEMYDRLYELERTYPKTPEVMWAIADVTGAIEQTISGEW